ncbi:alpha-1,4-glucan--maltose-1-phosphate maltosyltransferase [Pseudaminobacter sp. NGMCC 1.201702]|uniref:alpha-1,4-glucan--maltose-1-phosphate maltosyltransferase n=1 Tax=Pseudaminobacter sp. NGMCC 1.201702 TaxID=3391825 RepID=UPI0039F03E95
MRSTGKVHTKPAVSDAAPLATTDPSIARIEALAANRIAIENISTEIDGGRFPAKAIAGEDFVVEADIFGDGHDTIKAALVYRRAADSEWAEAPMSLVENDRWRGAAIFDEIGTWQFGVIAWRDLFATWREEVRKKIAANQRISLELTEGRRILEAAGDARSLAAVSRRLAAAANEDELLAVLLSDEARDLMDSAGPRTNLSRYIQVLDVWVDRPQAAFSAWYELMPRSQTEDPSRHGTLDDVIKRLPYVRDLGFDVLYFPPIHPIGTTNRKGRNNSLTARPGEPGSPYAIGSHEGGHDAIHPELGTIGDFERLVQAAREHGLEIALDFAIQCSPDHPWIKEHPEWFDWRPDGTIKFAENPPKKYEDIVNVHFYRGAIPGLWLALRDVVLFWIEHGVKIFRVDNPHTKPFPFWEWLIEEVRSRHPDTIFLAEAFTRPKVMKRLAKLGFTQSYSYFTWRNLKAELEEYLIELTQDDSRHVMRPNFFVNTPDINPLFLQQSGRPGFRTRLVLAATLAGNYGVYNGFEICEATAVPGKEEYLDSEKYQIRIWDMNRRGHIRDDIVLINRLRREHPALRRFESLRFYNAWNDNILYYGKSDAKAQSFLLFHVNLDPHNAQEADFEVPLWEFGLPDEASIEVEDLLHGNHFTWHGKSHRIRLDPHERPYAIWRLYPPGAPRS